MSGALAPVPPVAGTLSVGTWTPEQVALFNRTLLGDGFTSDEMALALTICRRTGLDPFSRQIHFVKRDGRMVVQTGIDGFRSMAEESGAYAGSDDYLFDEGLNEFQMRKNKRAQPITASATVYRMVEGQRVPTTASASWEEYFPGDKQGFMWRKMPFNQLGKCAEAKALRKAFPKKLSGIYVHEEMTQAGREDEPRTVEATVKPTQAKPSAPVQPQKAQIQKPPAGKPAKQLSPAVESMLANLTVGETVKLPGHQCGACGVEQFTVKKGRPNSANPGRLFLVCTGEGCGKQDGQYFNQSFCGFADEVLARYEQSRQEGDGA